METLEILIEFIKLKIKEIFAFTIIAIIGILLMLAFTSLMCILITSGILWSCILDGNITKGISLTNAIPFGILLWFPFPLGLAYCVKVAIYEIFKWIFSNWEQAKYNIRNK